MDDIIQSCYRKTDAWFDPIGDFLGWYSHDRTGNHTSRIEQLPPGTEDCLDKNPALGVITKTLKEIYEKAEDKSALPDIQTHWARRHGNIELFSIVWYEEFYADLSVSAVDLPAVLEDHYNLYLKNRRSHASTVRANRYYFEF